MDTNKPTVLIVDDEEKTRNLVADALEDENILLVEARDSVGLFSKLKDGNIDIVILDIDIPDLDGETNLFAGLEHLNLLGETYPDVPIIMFSDYKDTKLIGEAFRRGASEFIGKDQSLVENELIKSLARAWNERLNRISNGKPVGTDQNTLAIEKSTSDNFKTLHASENEYFRIREKRSAEKDRKKNAKLIKQELQEKNTLQEIENQITILKGQLIDASNEVQGFRGLKARNEVHEDLPLTVSVSLRFDVIPLGVYHLLGERGIHLARYEATNAGDEKTHAIATSQIERYSDPAKQTFDLAVGETKIVEQSPTLIPDNVKNIGQITNATFHSRFNLLADGQEKLVFDNTYTIKIHSKDTAPFYIKESFSGKIIDLTSLIAAWVTPHTSSVEKILSEAINFHPDKNIVGYQGNSPNLEERSGIARSQVKAMYEALKETAQLQYLNSTISYGQKSGESMQIIRLPEKSLEYSVANCIDGAVLYSSMIESADMNPIIILIPGHAFVGWETWEQSGEYEYLETTMTGYSSFEEAMDSGIEQYNQWNNNGKLRIINIKQLRAEGINPMPFAS